MKNSKMVLIVPLILAGCGSAPAVITETKIKYVDRVVIEKELVCCNCNSIKPCEFENLITTNGELVLTYKCLIQQKKLENKLKEQCR
ncbi:hypothetical protein GD1_74 [Paraglaciecola Antarctic GD virus 1]|nr:hypothetical protein GD1_74 [Paraglaciecola Antarctic GD virus 1]